MGGTEAVLAWLGLLKRERTPVSGDVHSTREGGVPGEHPDAPQTAKGRLGGAEAQRGREQEGSTAPRQPAAPFASEAQGSTPQPAPSERGIKTVLHAWGPAGPTPPALQAADVQGPAEDPADDAAALPDEVAQVPGPWADASRQPAESGGPSPVVPRVRRRTPPPLEPRGRPNLGLARLEGEELMWDAGKRRRPRWGRFLAAGAFTLVGLWWGGGGSGT